MRIQLDLLKQLVYTFGGKDYFNEKGKYGEMATAANVGWKASE